MDETASVSKSMSKVESNTRMGASSQWWNVFLMWSVGSIAILYPIATRAIVYPYIFILYFVLILWWIIFIVYFRNTKKQVHTWLHIKYLYRAYTGQTVVMKYVVPVRTIENIIPIKNVNKFGVISFKFRHWGVIMRMVSNRIDNTDLIQHLDLIKNLLDSMPKDVTVKIISSNYVNHDGSLELGLLEMSNDKNKTDEQKEHLYQLYRTLVDEEADIIDNRTVIFIDLGKHKTLAEAEIKRQEFLPGFIDGLARMEAYCTPVTDESEISLLYKRLALVR